MKICRICKEEKALDDFYPKKDTCDRRDSYCKTCSIARSAQWAKENKYRVKEKAAARSKKRWQVLKGSPEYAEEYEQVKKRIQSHYEKNKFKYAARNRVARAIKSGRLERKPCEVCGSDKLKANGARDICAHHDDYRKPLEVRWLCGDHHREWHRKHGEAKS